EAVVKLRTPVWCRPKALRCLSVTSSRVREGASKLRKGACRREVLTPSCLPKGRCDVIACSRGGASKLRKGACRREVLTSSCLPKGRCDVIACSRGVLPSFGRVHAEGKV
ncbi:unnamed protein product, partial [Prunus brigantina]